MEAQGNVTAAPVTLAPGVFSSYGNGWKQLWPHFLVLFLIGVIYFVLSLVTSIPSWIVNGISGSTTASLNGATFALTIISIAYAVFFLYPISYGQNYAYSKAVRNDNVEVQDMFEVFQNYWNAVGAYLLVSIIVSVGFILLIVPGIIFTCKLAFVPYLVVDKKMSVSKAINASWHMTSGHAGKVFLIRLLAIPIFFAGIICLGIGVIISIMWVNAALASLYHAVSKKEEAEMAPAMPPPVSPVQPA